MKVLNYGDFKIIEKYNMDGEMEDYDEDEVSDIFTLADSYDKEHKTSFFKEFIEIFPTKKDFDSELREYYAYDKGDEDEEMDVEQEMEKYWTPEIEVEMLEKEIMANYPGDKSWINFFNELMETEWNEK